MRDTRPLYSSDWLSRSTSHENMRLYRAWPFEQVVKEVYLDIQKA